MQGGWAGGKACPTRQGLVYAVLFYFDDLVRREILHPAVPQAGDVIAIHAVLPHADDLAGRDAAVTGGPELFRKLRGYAVVVQMNHVVGCELESAVFQSAYEFRIDAMIVQPNHLIGI